MAYFFKDGNIGLFMSIFWESIYVNKFWVRTLFRKFHWTNLVSRSGLLSRDGRGEEEGRRTTVFLNLQPVTLG